MSDYQHGSMDVSAQEGTYAGFLSFLIKVCVVTIGLLVFLAIFVA